MSTLQVRLSDLITALGTDYKAIWAKVGTAALDTTSQNLSGAVNELVASIASATIPDATTTVKGKVELATDAETLTGTDTVRALTPSNLAASWTDRIDTSTSLGTSNTKVPSQNAAKTYIDGIIDAANGVQYKGVIDCSSNPNYPAASAGHLYRVSVAGKIGGASGTNVEVGDTLLCLTDSTSAGTQAAVGANWNIIQSNIDGAVVGPASSTASDFATFSGTTGKIIQDSGVALDTDTALTANSDAKVPSQKAVKAYAQPLDSDLTSIAALSTTSYGRGILTTADQAALTAALAAATESLPGIAELATTAETTTGTDDARIVTPLKLRQNMGDPDTNLVSLYTTAKA